MAATGGALLLAKVREPASADLAARAEALGRRHGLIIGFGDPARFYVPPFEAADAAIPDGEMGAVAISDLEPALDGITASLALYPPGFVARFCQAIFVCGKLRFGGVSAGGTYGPAWIILAADPVVGPGGIRETARLGVHHELSSLVLARVPELLPSWEATLPSGWQPVARTEDALRRVGSEEEHDGFLSAYAATSVENDFNTYAETVFGDTARLSELIRTSDLVRRKALLLINTYVSLDERLIATFRRLGLGELLVGDRRSP